MVVWQLPMPHPQLWQAILWLQGKHGCIGVTGDQRKLYIFPYIHSSPSLQWTPRDQWIQANRLLWDKRNAHHIHPSWKVLGSKGKGENKWCNYSSSHPCSSNCNITNNWWNRECDSWGRNSDISHSQWRSLEGIYWQTAVHLCVMGLGLFVPL